MIAYVELMAKFKDFKALKSSHHPSYTLISTGSTNPVALPTLPGDEECLLQISCSPH